jgi:hypothetical protein
MWRADQPRSEINRLINEDKQNIPTSTKVSLVGHLNSAYEVVDRECEREELEGRGKYLWVWSVECPRKAGPSTKMQQSSPTSAKVCLVGHLNATCEVEEDKE